MENMKINSEMCLLLDPEVVLSPPVAAVVVAAAVVAAPAVVAAAVVAAVAAAMVVVVRGVAVMGTTFSVSKSRKLDLLSS